MRVYDESKSRDYYKETSEERELRHGNGYYSASDEEAAFTYSVNGVPVNDTSGKYVIILFLMMFAFPFIMMLFNFIKMFFLIKFF